MEVGLEMVQYRCHQLRESIDCPQFRQLLEHVGGGNRVEFYARIFEFSIEFG
jgi:hypothetical protein